MSGIEGMSDSWRRCRERVGVLRRGGSGEFILILLGVEGGVFLGLGC